ncbi:hypothetical protein B296_00052769, partial [Ensete ventricosum]
MCPQVEVSALPVSGRPYDRWRIGITCVRSAVRPLGIWHYLCQVGRTTAGVSALPVPGRPHDCWRPHACVRPVSCVGSATSAGQLSEGVMMWRPGHYVSYQCCRYADRPVPSKIDRRWSISVVG